MSDKPKIYGTCDAGCLWETVHKEDFLSSAYIAKMQPKENGTYGLLPYKTYKIERTATKPEWGFTVKVCVRYNNNNKYVTLSLPDPEVHIIDGTSYCYDKYLILELLGTITKENDAGQYDLFIVARCNGEVCFVATDLSSTDDYPFIINEPDSLIISGTDIVYLINEDATIEAKDGKSAYEIALDNGFEGTEEEWLESLKGGGSGTGENGATFTPSVSSAGVISWTNDKDLENPDPVNIKGGDGKSAYEHAKEGGYTNVEKVFNVKLKETVDYTAQDLRSDLSVGNVHVEKAVTDRNGNVIDNTYATKEELGIKIPSYWQTALEEGAEAINTALCEAGRNKSAFLFYSDAHWNYGSQMSPKLLKYLYEHTGMTKTFFGGDIVHDEATEYDTMEYLWEWRNMLKGVPNHHSVVGNHDDGNATNNLFSEQYVYGYLLAAEETPDIVRGDSGLYYYIDNGAEKTRYIFLDTAYKGMSSDQKDFLKEALIGTAVGWHIVVISHIWHDTIYPDADAGITDYGVGDFSTDGTSVLAMLDNYNSRNGDYADCGGWVEFCIGGHTHIDHDSTSSTGIPVILVETDSKHVRSGLGFTAGTTTESSVNGIIADYDNHKIYIVRIGRGESREVEITNYQVSYTNVLPLALAADGTSVYNGKGWKENTRWSSSGNSEGTASGIYLTGWIPASDGDTIYLKNITMPYVSGNTCMIHFFNDSFTTANNNLGYEFIKNNFNGIWDSDNNLIQFTLANTGCTHIRIQCGGITDASIITINEPIE